MPLKKLTRLLVLIFALYSTETLAQGQSEYCKIIEQRSFSSNASDRTSTVSREFTIDAIAGKAKQLKWEFKDHSIPTKEIKCFDKLVLVAEFDGAVRFGPGAVVALPGASSLFGLPGNEKRTRAYVVIPTEKPPNSFDLKVSFWESGTTNVSMKLYLVMDRRRHKDLPFYSKLPATKSWKVTVSPGDYIVRPADAFDTAPVRKIRLNDTTRYTLNDYGDYFRVYSPSNEVILFAAGREANFSPSGRFVATVFEHGLDVYDLSAGRLIYRQRLEAGVHDFTVTAIAWTLHDSYMIFSWSSQGALGIVPTTVDNTEWRTGCCNLYRRQEPGHASTISISLIENSIKTHYGNSTLTKLSTTNTTPENTAKLFAINQNNSSSGKWDSVDWKLNDDFVLTHDFTDKPKRSLVEANVKVGVQNDTYRTRLPSSAHRQLESGSHHFYQHRISSPSYVRFGAVFDKPQSVSWRNDIQLRLETYLKENGIAVGNFVPMALVYSTEPSELLSIIDDVKRSPPVSDINDTTNINFHDRTTFVYRPGLEYLENFYVFLQSERQKYQESGFSGFVTAEIIAQPSERSNMIFFPNNLSNEYNWNADIGFMSIFTRLPFARDLILQSNMRRTDFSSAELKQIDDRDPPGKSEIDCIGSDGSLPKVLTWAVRDVWAWTNDKERVWIIQSSCSGGLRGDWQLGQVTLIHEMSDGAVFKTVIGNDRCHKNKVPCSFLSAEIASLKVGVVDNRYVLLKGYNNSVIAYDLLAHQTVAQVKDNTLSSNSFAGLTKDAKYVILIANSGEINIIESKSSSSVLRGMYIDDEVILFNSSGRFISTEDGTSYVQLHIDGLLASQTLRQFRRLLFDSNLVTNSLSHNSPMNLANIPLSPDVIISNKVVRGGIQKEVRLPPYGSNTILYVFGDGNLIRTEEISSQGRTVVLDDSELKANYLDLVRIGDNGVESPVYSFKGLGTKQKGKLYLLSFGVRKYSDQRIPELKYAESDASNFCRVIRNGKSSYYDEIVVPDDCITTSRKEINADLAYISQRATIDDTVFIFMAGHGIVSAGGDFYLARDSTNLDNIEGTAIAWKDVVEILGNVKGKVVLFMDTCHSGRAGRLLTNDSLVDRVTKTIRTPVYVLSASKGRQKSWEVDTLAGGAFSSFLVHIFKNRDSARRRESKFIELGDLFLHLKSRLVKFSDGVQTPWLSTNYSILHVPLF